MLARVLIVIVVVAVLGFFGTRGSEKVVEEVTERQELVDALGKRVVELEEKTRALEAERARAQEQHAQHAEDSKRALEQLHQRVTDLERTEAARASSHDGKATVDVVMRRRALVFADGKLIADAPKSGEQAPQLTVGMHALEVDSGQKRARYQLHVTHASARNKLIVDGTELRASGDLVLTRFP